MQLRLFSTLVGSGVELVAEAGKSLEHIIGRVYAINAAIAAIASGADAQASGIEDVYATTSTMDRATQRNMEMVEVTTSAAEALAKEAEELRSGVAVFRVSEMSSAALRQREAARPVRGRAAA